MYQTTDYYRKAIDGNKRGTFRAEIHVNGVLLDPDAIKEMSHTSYIVPDGIGIGNAMSSVLKITAQTENMFENAELGVGIIMEMKPQREYIPIGRFVVETVERNEDTITVTAYDNIKRMDVPYVSRLKYPAALFEVAQEICASSGVMINPDVTFPDMEIPKAISGTCREAIAKAAEYMGCNVVADRNGDIDFRWFSQAPLTIDPEYRHYSFEKQENDYTLGSIVCITGDTTTITSGEGKGISISDPDMTQDRLDELREKLTITYRGGKCAFLGDPAIEVGDIITITDLSGNGYQVPVMEMTTTFDGGIKQEITAFAETDTQVELNSGVSITKRLIGIEKSLDGIVATVGREYATREYLQAQLKIAADEISSTVSQSLDGETLVSKINQTAKEIIINASKINLQGYATFTDLEGGGKCTINGANITAGTIMSQNYLKKDKDGNIIYDNNGEAVATGEGTMMDLESGRTTFSGKYNYAWLDKPSEEHNGAIDMESGRIRVYDRNADAFLYISYEGISTTVDANEASGVLDYRSDLFGDSAQGNQYKGVTLLTKGSPAAMASKISDVIIAPHMEDKANGNKITVTTRDNGNAAINYGQRAYDGTLKRFTNASGMEFSCDPDDPTVYINDGDGNRGKGNIVAANLPKAVKGAKAVMDDAGRITRLSCTMEDGSRETVDVSYNDAGDIARVGDTTITY